MELLTGKKGYHDVDNVRAIEVLFTKQMLDFKAMHYFQHYCFLFLDAALIFVW
jgi:hypothetical protein